MRLRSLLAAVVLLATGVPVHAQVVPLSPWAAGGPVIVFPVQLSNPLGTTLAGPNLTLQSGQFLAPDGTSPLPSYSFASDPTIGIWKSAASTVGIRGGLSTSSSASFAGNVYTGDGTAALPSYSFTSATSTGLYRYDASGLAVTSAGNPSIYLGPALRLSRDSGIAWTNSPSNPNTTVDTGLSRVSAGVVGVGTGALASVAGDMSLNTLIAGGNVNVSGSGGVSSSVLRSTTGMTQVTNNAVTIGSTLKVDNLPSFVSGGGGTTPAAVVAGSTPFAGAINVGTGVISTPILINFNGTAFPSVPFCTVGASIGPNLTTVNPTTTQLSLGGPAWSAGTVLSWICVSSR